MRRGYCRGGSSVAGHAEARRLNPQKRVSQSIALVLLRLCGTAHPGAVRPTLSDLIGEILTPSEIFRIRCAADNVRLHRSGRKHFHDPVVGALDLAFDTMTLSADAGLALTAYTAEPAAPLPTVWCCWRVGRPTMPRGTPRKRRRPPARSSGDRRTHRKLF
jgi:hypothetical protein